MENQLQETWNKPNSNIPYFKVEPIVVLILGVLTCGLYHIYWNIKMAEVLNAVSGRQVISQPIAIFAGCCYPVNVYFFYLVGKEAMPKVYEKTGTQKDDSALLLILGFFLPMAAAMIVQGDVNKLFE